MRRFSIVFGVSAMAFAAFGFTGCQPSIQCGAVVTQDLTLTSDIVGCAGDGLIVGADDITVNLNGHSVSAGGTGSAGIRLVGFDGVTVKRGVVRGVTTGLSISDAQRVTVVDVRAVGDYPTLEDGMLLERVTDSTILRSQAMGLYGFRLVESHRNRLHRVSSGEGPDGTNSLKLESSDHNRITEGSFGTSNDGIYLTDSDDNLIADNHASNGDAFGIAVDRSDRNIIRRNRIDNEFGGIRLADSADNLLADNVGLAESVIVIRRSDRTKLRYNDVTGIQLLSSNDAVLVGNLVRTIDDYDDGVGISVSADSPRARLINNEASRQVEDGFQVDAPGTVLTRNVATYNGDLGIDAVPGVVDGGGNRASGNGNPLQCTNVACAPWP